MAYGIIQEEKVNLVDDLLNTRRYDPHSILGLHTTREGKVIRLYRPDAENVYLEVKNEILQATKVHPCGLFEYRVANEIEALDYRVYHQSGLLAHDPYAFLPTFGELDAYLFGKGVNYNLHKVMGGRPCVFNDTEGVKFTVWAPSAKQVSLVGDFNYWDGRTNPMRSLGSSGIYEIFIPGLKVGEKYKFEITTQNNELRVKSDPYALYSEIRPNTASIVQDPYQWKWNDAEWIQNRKSIHKTPISIYEVHLGSWKRRDGHFMNYRDIARDISSYCKEMGFTHIELMPLSEHPFDESWGYQVTGYFAITSRYGTCEDFQYFVDHLHQNGIGVIMDFVPGHFPFDDFALARFDGTCLYEHEDERQGFHPHWNTCIFNFGRPEVSNFLISSAINWFDVYHIDGLRVDAVASMLYLDYGRDEGKWIPNKYGGKENIEAIEFIKHLNSIVHEKFPNVCMIAEESTSFTGVSHPLEYNGLGFDLKWNMGWMNDTLRYFRTDPLFRLYHHNDLTFGLLYAFSENFILVFSHDEVVHGKGSLLSKMPGDYWQKFANLRLLLSYQMCQPGKKLLFMGQEIGQWNEWYCKAEVEWSLLQYPSHAGIQTLVKDLNHLYVTEKMLHDEDLSYHGFEWIDFNDTKNSVISYYRKSPKNNREALLCVHNFTPQYHHEYIIPVRSIYEIEEIFNSDDVRYGGSGKTKMEIHILRNEQGYPWGIKLSLAPLATCILRVKK